MAEPDAPPDIHIQHDTPPIFYCWKYWMKTGEFHQGCTPVESSPDKFLDLNDYGWVYIVIPILALFLLIFLFYCCCRGRSNKPKPQALMSDESDTDDEEVFRSRAKSSAPYRAVPVRNSDARNFYTVVPIDPNDPRKMPLQGGIDPTYQGYIPQQRLYPRLTAMRQQAGLNGQVATKTNGRSKPSDLVRTNDYQPDPSRHDIQPKVVATSKPVVNEAKPSSSSESEEEQ